MMPSTSRSAVIVGRKRNIPKNAVCTGKRIQRRLPTFQGVNLGAGEPVTCATSVVDPKASPQSYSNRCNCQYHSQDATVTAYMPYMSNPDASQTTASGVCRHRLAAIRM